MPRESNSSSPTCVYAIHVDGMLRYIGKGTNDRMYAHMKEVRQRLTRKFKPQNVSPLFQRKLTEAAMKGAVVEEVVLADNLTSKQAYKLEYGGVLSISNEFRQWNQNLNKPSNGEQEHTEGQQQPQAPSVTPTRMISPEPNNPKTAEQKSNPSQANGKQHKLLDIVAITVAVFAFGAAAWQGYVSYDSERRTLRAYIFVDKATLLNFDSPAYTVEIIIKNTGQTPAYNVVHWMATGIGEFPVPKAGFPPPPSNTWVSIDTMASQAISEHVASRAFRDGNKEAMQMGVAALWVFGRIDYEDIFHRKCWTAYRYYVGGDMGLKGNQLFSAKQGNDADRHCNSRLDW